MGILCVLGLGAGLLRFGLLGDRARLLGRCCARRQPALLGLRRGLRQTVACAWTSKPGGVSVCAARDCSPTRDAGACQTADERTGCASGGTASRRRTSLHPPGHPANAG